MKEELIHKATIQIIKYISQAKHDHTLLYWTHCNGLATNDKPQISSQFQISLMPEDICCVYSPYPSTCKNHQKDIIKVKGIWNIFFWPKSLSFSDFWFLLSLAETSSYRIWAFKLYWCRNVFSNNSEGINQIKRIATKQ